MSVQDGVTWRRHVDHLKELGPQPGGEREPDSSAELDTPPEESEFLLPSQSSVDAGSTSTPVSNSGPSAGTVETPSSTATSAATTTTSRVYPSRSRQPPEWYGRIVTH